MLFDILIHDLTVVIGIIGVIITAPLCIGITPYAIYIRIAYAIKHAKAEKREADELSQEEIYQKEVAKQQEKYSQRISDIRRTEKESSRVVRDVNDKHRFTPDVDIGEKGYADEDDSSKLSQITVDDYEEEPEEKGETSEVIDRLVEDFRKNGDDDGDEPPFDTSVGTTFSGNQIKRKSDMPLSSGVGAIYADPIKEVKKKTPAPTPGVPSPTAPAAAEIKEESGNGQLISDSELAMLNNFAKAQQENEAKKNDMMAGKEGAEYMSQEEEEDLPPVKKAYVFPPLSLLKYDLTPKNVDISDELSTNANKLVETLKSFKVETRLINVSRGPAITRYELQPKEGVRVKQIANLVDAIALNLATTGVRIEAPIPGKAAVGVEVPNKTISTVYLRELVDTETFSKAASKLNVCLGVDVAGEPVYLDIAKMPHLLIAGATGMGKSVCINSIITSILYKSSPDDVKMILIDPKKVEFDIYSGLPHLLVPVVSDPKQAAGALQWAVTEMERRFDLIGSVGVRDVKMYNQVTADDYDKEHLCSIVIIIDELADLMMTAPDDVEASICRLAQKARAAGMHIIIGTQRPSVDVITGLIKANVPSRIAFTVASQTDSRVVLDMAGAEKLIGRGDMLYAPVGSPKPRRVQGAYVSESETEAIVNFIKENNVETEYDSSVTEAIERNAAACGNEKGSAGSAQISEPDSGEGDPMLRQAIELAIESGKISTSLIQRRLSLGYGRAAKLIDEM
ncbi:MAG: DNA translocase FtsK, partial [Firmicutes bacterium]|nr:DNA translocase FtsK [Candidatus Colimorpha enterica]